MHQLNYLDDFETVLINSKPKKAHKKLGADAFRGSIFRGVSRNKAKWQVGYKISLI